MIKAVFWDYDNTILATAEAHWQKHVMVLNAYGIKLEEIHRKRVYENNGKQNWEWMINELNLKIPENEYLQAIDAEFKNQVHHLTLRTGVLELLELLNTLNIPQAIVTNARRNSAEPILLQKSILPFMKFVCYKEDYEGRKPDPSPYLKGIEKMKPFIQGSLSPSQCLAIEDDPKGVESAHKAGAIVIQRKLFKEEPDSPFAHYWCYDEKDFCALIKHLCF